MEFSNAIRQRIINLTVENKMSLNQVATRAGMPYSTLNSFLNGKSNDPKFSTIYLVCIGLDVTLSEFFDDNLFSENVIFD